MRSTAVRRFTVEVVYATAERQTLIELEVAEGTTIGQAVALSGVAAAHPELDFSTIQTGIFGRRAPLDCILRERDRVEIYRPLRADPKEVRRRRAGIKARRAGSPRR